MPVCSEPQEISSESQENDDTVKVVVRSWKQKEKIHAKIALAGLMQLVAFYRESSDHNRVYRFR